jgi:U6 snRNA-associated Sm-like protein LSm6
MSSKPSDFLKTVIGKQVRVRLSDGTDYLGRLLCLDGFMNIAIEGVEEQKEPTRKYGTSFIRGNNVLYITAV